MKNARSFILILISLLFASVSWADCTISLVWTPDPSQSAVLSQEVWYDPDTTVADNEEMKADLGKADTMASFVITGNDAPNDVVWIKTKYVGDIELDSQAVSPIDVVGASGVIVIQQCN